MLALLRQALDFSNIDLVFVTLHGDADNQLAQFNRLSNVIVFGDGVQIDR